MRIRFTWQPDEWHEAVQLATTAPRPHRDMPFMVYGVLGIMSLGAMGDLFEALRAGQAGLAGGKVLMVSAFTLAAGSGLVWLTRTRLHQRRRMRMPPVPEGEQQATFQETGWSTSTGSAAGALRSWSDLQLARNGSRALVVIGEASTFTAVPLRVLSQEEAEHLERLLARKLRPSLKDDLMPAAASTSC